MVGSLLDYVMVPVCFLVAMAFLTLFERKFLAAAQRRVGPNKTGLAGLPQPIADAMKLFQKEESLPSRANQLAFMAAPIFALALSLVMTSLYPSPYNWHLPAYSCLLMLAVSSLSVFALLLAGWASNSAYALFGTVRAVAQTISYEVSMGILLLCFLVLTPTYYFTGLVGQGFVVNFPLLLPLSLAWIVMIFAETHRAPFDFVEGESELVSGYNVEYSGNRFALLFMAEYVNILILSVLSATLLFVPGPFPDPCRPLAVTGSALVLVWLFVATRASQPRMRYDHLMKFTWTRVLPGALAGLMLAVAFSLSVGGWVEIGKILVLVAKLMAVAFSLFTFVMLHRQSR